MRKFPDFIRSEKNRVPEAPEGMEGYVFDGADGSQIVLWENETGGSVGLHTHDFWEYCLVLLMAIMKALSMENLLVRTRR